MSGGFHGCAAKEGGLGVTISMVGEGIGVLVAEDSLLKAVQYTHSLLTSGDGTPVAPSILDSVFDYFLSTQAFQRPTISRIHNSTARCCQAIRDANKQKRLDWCTKLIAEKDRFDNIIFTDESTFQLECHQRKCFHKKMPRKL